MIAPMGDLNFIVPDELVHSEESPQDFMYRYGSGYYGPTPTCPDVAPDFYNHLVLPSAGSRGTGNVTTHQASVGFRRDVERISDAHVALLPEAVQKMAVTLSIMQIVEKMKHLLIPTPFEEAAGLPRVSSFSSVSKEIFSWQQELCTLRESSRWSDTLFHSSAPDNVFRVVSLLEECTEEGKLLPQLTTGIQLARAELLACLSVLQNIGVEDMALRMNDEEPADWVPRLEITSFQRAIRTIMPEQDVRYITLQEPGNG